MSDVLYRWPLSAAVGRAVPKTKFYDYGKVRAALREKFVDDVQKITWAYKLADSTIRLEGSVAVPEIQVFRIETKGGNFGEDVLTVIDKSIQFPVIFELIRGDAVRTVAAHKTLGGAAPKVGTYFSTGWVPTDTARTPLPTVIDLPTLYDAILEALLPGAVRRGESVSEATARMDMAKKVEREIAALERRLRTEPQLNRKVELRRELRDRRAVLAALA